MDTMTEVAAIRKYFFPVDAPASEVLKEIKALSPEDKHELAVGAAKELGVTLKNPE